VATAIQARWGTPEQPMPVIVPPYLAEAGIVQRVQRALLGRPELWSKGEHPEASCRPGATPERSPVCTVPAGAAWTGDDGSEGSPPGYAPPRRRPVGAFAIDQREVTGADYGRCVAAGACKSVDLDTSYCKELTKGHPELPLPCVSFHDAQAYCTWAGARLPTESEWARAARGETAAAFPWGTTFPSSGEPRGNFGEKPSTGDPHYATVPTDAAWPSDGHPGLAPACSFAAGKSPFGVCDLAGNLAEWVTVEGGPPRLMGGSWLDGEAAAFRVGSHADVMGGPGWYVSGFRCAR
jgi:formylglycine-generating enzyme required for sulfatase activity